MKFFCFAILLMVHNVALAQSSEVAAEAKAVAMEKSDKKQGWTHSEGITIGGNFIEQENVVGQPDGRTNSYNLKLNFDLTRKTDHTEWENKLGISETMVKTPSIDRFIKTEDVFVLALFTNTTLRKLLGSAYSPNSMQKHLYLKVTMNAGQKWTTSSPKTTKSSKRQMIALNSPKASNH